MAISDTLQDFSVFNGVGIILTVIAVLLFLIFLAYSLTYLKELSAKIIYLIRVASKVAFEKHKKRQAKKKAKYGVSGAGAGGDDDGPDSDDQDPQDQFYQELKNNWKKEIYNDRVGRFKSLFYSILVKYNYQLFCCCKVKKFNTLNEYDLLKPNPVFQWLLFAASLGTLWYISLFLTAVLHSNSQYDARDLADLTFLFYVLIICLVASPCIIFIIWALWRYYNKTISHAMTTGNQISKQQRQGIYYDFRGSQDSLVGLDEFDPSKQPEVIEGSRNGSVTNLSQRKYVSDDYKRNTINFPNNQDQRRYFQDMDGQGSDRMLMSSQKHQNPHSTFHHSGISNGAVNKSATNLQKKPNLSKIDQENLPLSRSSRQSRHTFRNYGPFASDQHITPEHSVHSSEQINNSYRNNQARKQTNHLRVSQYSNNPNNSQNFSRLSLPPPSKGRITQSGFAQPRRYTTVDRTRGNSMYATSQNQQGQSLKIIDTGNNLLWNNPVPRMKGYFSRLVSPHSCKDATWYGIAAIMLLGMTIVACFLCLIFQRNLALYVLFLFIVSFLLDMLITRNFFLLIIALFHFCCYRQKRNVVERKYRFKYSEMVRIQQAKNLQLDDEQAGIYRNISAESEEYADNQKARLTVKKSDPRMRKSTIGKAKKNQNEFLDYPDKLQQVNEQENQDGPCVTSYGPCGDLKRRAWITSPDRDQKMKHLKQNQIQARRMTESQKRKKKDSKTKNEIPVLSKQNGFKHGDDSDDILPAESGAGNKKYNKMVFATPGKKNGYSPIKRLQSQEQLTDRDGFSRSSPLRMLDLMSSRRKNESGANLNEGSQKRGSGLKDSCFSPSRHHAKEKWAHSPNKKPYYLNKGQLVRVFSPGDGAQSFDHPGDDENDVDENDIGEMGDDQEINKRLMNIEDDDKKTGRSNRYKKQKSNQKNQEQQQYSDPDQQRRVKISRVDPKDRQKDGVEDDDDDDDNVALKQKEVVGSGYPVPKENDQDNIIDDEQDDDVNGDDVNGDDDNVKNTKYFKPLKVHDSRNQKDDDEEELKHAKSLDIDFIGYGQTEQDQPRQEKFQGRIAYIPSLEQKPVNELDQDQHEFQKRQKKLDGKDDDDDDDEIPKQGIIAVSGDEDQVLSYDRRSTLPLDEIYGTQNPVSELNDMNLILLDQIYDAFGDGTQQVLKSFKNNHLDLPKEEDDLTEITEQSQTITEEDDQDDDDDDDRNHDVQIRVFNNDQADNFKKQGLVQDGLEMLEILQKLDFWREGDYPFDNDQSPFEQEMNKRQNLNRPLSSMSQKKGYKIDQPVIEEDQQEQLESEHMFSVKEAEGEQQRLSDYQDLKIQDPIILLSDTEQDGERLDYVSISTDPCQKSNEQDSRYGGENRQLPIKLDRVHQSKDSRIVDECDNKSELDAVSKLRDDSQLGGSLQMPGDKLFRGYADGEVQINDGISRPLRDVKQSKHFGPGKEGMQDSNIGVNPISVRLDNEELPVGQDENEEESNVESSKLEQGLMVDDAQIRNRKKIKPPTLLELTQKGRDNMPIQGMPLEDGQNQAIDQLENNDAKIHDERNQYAEEIENQMEEDMYLNDGERLPSQLLEANFPTPVPKENIKHSNSLTKSFSRSKSPNSIKRDSAVKFYPEQSPKSPENLTRSDFSGSKNFGSSKQPGRFIINNAEIDQNSRNSSIIENEEVKFAHQVNDGATTDLDQVQGQQRTQYSRKDPKRQFKPRPGINQMRQTDRDFDVENAQGDNAMLPPRSTGEHFFGSPGNRSQYPDDFDGGFTTDFKRRHPRDDDNDGTKRNNFINQSDTDRMMRGGPQMLARPGMNRFGSSDSKDPKQISYPRQIISNKNPQLTSDSQSLAFKVINQGPDSNMTRTQDQDGFGGPAGTGYYIPRGRSKGMYASDDEYGGVSGSRSGRRDSRGYQPNYRGRSGEGGRVSDPFNRQYEPTYGGTAFTHITKTKRTGGGYKYESSTSLQPPTMRSYDDFPRHTPRGPLSLSPPPLIEQPNQNTDNNRYAVPPRHDAKDKIKNWRKMARKSNKKHRGGMASGGRSMVMQQQKQNFKGPYADVSVQSQFFQHHYGNEIKDVLKKEKQFKESHQHSDEESPEGHHKRRYQPTFPTNTKAAMKQLIQRAPEALKQVKKQKKKRESGHGTEYLIDDEAMRKVKLYGDQDMKLNISRMREDHKNSFNAGNESERYEGDDEQNLKLPPRNKNRYSTPRRNEDPDTLVLNFNPTARHLQHQQQH